MVSKKVIVGGVAAIIVIGGVTAGLMNSGSTSKDKKDIPEHRPWYEMFDENTPTINELRTNNKHVSDNPKK